MVSKLSDEINSELNNDTNKKLYCYVCNIVVNYEIHKKETEHLLKMDYFAKYFIEESDNLVKCTVCSKDVVKNDVNKHASQHELIPWHRPKNEFQKYFINFIALNNDIYRCYLCHKEVKYWFQAVSHLTDPEHLLHMAKIDKKNCTTSFPVDLYEKCVLHCIFPFSTNEIKCFICDTPIAEYGNIEKHIATKNHNKLRFSSRQADNNLLSPINKNCVLQSSQTEFYLQYFKNFIGILKNDEHWCYLCGKQFNNWDVAIHHIESPKHQSALISPIDDDKIDTSLSLDFYEKCIQHSIFPKSFNELECVICECYFPGYRNIDEHISGKNHRMAMDPYLLFFNNFIGIIEKIYRCYVCVEFFNNEHEATTHIKTSNHKLLLNNLDFTSSKVSLPSEYRVFIEHSIFSSSKFKFKCFMCNDFLPGYSIAKQHIKSQKHQQSYALHKSDGQFSLSKICNNESYDKCRSTEDYIQCFTNFIGFIESQYWCFLCNQNYHQNEKAITHTHSSNHQDKITKSQIVYRNLSRQFYEHCIQHGIFPMSFDKVKCLICKMSFKYLNAIEHPNSRRHINNILAFGAQLNTLSSTININSKKKTKESIVKYDQCFINCIGIIKNIYWCFICHEKCDYWDLTISHIQSSKHRSNIIDLIDIKDINLKLASNFYENCVQQGIFPISPNNVKCFICNRNISAYLNANGHSTSIRHKKQYFAWKFPSNSILSSENCYDENKFEEDFSNSNKNSDDDHNDSIDENDVPETWETIIDSDYKGKVITTLESRALKNKTVIAKVGKLNSAQNKSVNKKKNETDDGWILVDSINNQSKIKNLSLKTTDSKLKSSEKRQQKKLSNINNETGKSKKTKKMKQKLNKPTLQRTNKTTSSQVSNYRKFVFCIICKQKFKSEVILHIHLTSHFWPRFVQQNDSQETAIDLSSQNSKLNNNQNPVNSVNIESFANTNILSNTYVNNTFILQKALDETTQIAQTSAQIYNANSLYTQVEIPNILNSNPETLSQKKKHDNKKTNEVIKSRGFRPRKIQNSHGSGQLTVQAKFKNKKYLVKAADISEPNKTRKIDIYKIDPIQLKMINLSITRCYLLDKENIYCLICREKISYSVNSVFEHFRSINHNDYLLEMIQDHIKFMSFPDQLSDFSLAREWMEDISDEFVECYTCQKKIINNISSLKDHLSEKDHTYQRAQVASKMDTFFESLYSKMERNWYKVRSYWCVPCRKNYLLESEFYKHINVSGIKNNKHLKQCQKFSKFTNFILDYCPTCTTLFYGFRDTFAYHCEIEKHKYFRERPFYNVNQLPSAVEKMLSEPDSVINKMIELLDAKAQKRQEDEKLIIEDLETIVNHFMSAKAYAFGSRANGLSSETSDLDIFLDCENRYYQGRKTDDINHILKQVENSLQNCTEIWAINRTITDCNVPIIKVTHKPLNIECDISFLNGLTTECSQLIKTINQKFPLCRKLILFVKQWINMCNLSGEKGISKYAVTWMVIYYLQTKTLIKSIITLIKERDESKMIGGWETGASLDFSIPESNESFKDLLKGFFVMITTFDYRNNIICPFLGEPLEKIRFSDAKKLLPGEMETYKQNCKRKNHELFRIDSPLCVQDPYDLSHNITKATKKFTVSKLITFSALTVKKLNDGDVRLD